MKHAAGRLLSRRLVSKMDYWFDWFNADGITGWAIHPSGLRAVRIRLDDTLVGQAAIGLPRADVAEAKGHRPYSSNSGFMFAFGESTFNERNGEVTVTVEFEAADGTRVEHSQDILGLRMNADSDAALPREAVMARAPFPYRVVSALRQLRPDVYAEPGRWSDDLVGGAVDDLLSMVSQRAPVKPVLRYVLYLKAMATVFEFIGDHFDRINHLTEPDGKDVRAIASSPAEMLCIANHLYVLQSHGLEGGFVECGCFKGFSTCCLSQACDAVGLQLDVFDSFAGLPKSASSYYQEGEFRGSIDEVRDNLRAFGRARSVELHQGFFADTIPPHQGQVMGIWMDVDLQSSSQDVMQMLPRLPITSCVFTHECPPDTFENGRPVPSASEVLPPIVEAFRKRGSEPAGMHLAGYLGVVFDADRGLPVLDLESVKRLAHSS